MLPLRMCAACRERRDKSELLRIVKAPDGSVRIDKDGKLPGRGAYICKAGECVKQAEKRRALERALSCGIDKSVYEMLKEMSED